MPWRSEEHTSELQSQSNLVCRLLLEKKKATAAHHCDDTSFQPSLSASHCRVVYQQLISDSTTHGHSARCHICSFFFFSDTAATEIYTLSLHDALPISRP